MNKHVFFFYETILYLEKDNLKYNQTFSHMQNKQDMICIHDHVGIMRNEMHKIPGKEFSMGKVSITCNKQVGIWIKPCRKRSTFSRELGGTGVMTYSRPLSVSTLLTIPGKGIR